MNSSCSLNAEKSEFFQNCIKVINCYVELQIDNETISIAINENRLNSEIAKKTMNKSVGDTFSLKGTKHFQESRSYGWINILH
jgi:hypothetical protein